MHRCRVETWALPLEHSHFNQSGHHWSINLAIEPSGLSDENNTRCAPSQNIRNISISIGKKCLTWSWSSNHECRQGWELDTSKWGGEKHLIFCLWVSACVCVCVWTHIITLFRNEDKAIIVNHVAVDILRWARERHRVISFEGYIPRKQGTEITKGKPCFH